MFRFLSVVAISAAAVFAVPASAATFDFAAMADNFFANNTAIKGNGTAKYEATFDQLEVSTTGSLLTDGGVSVTSATATHTGGPAHAFFDAGRAGLGVCHSGFTGTVSSLGGNVSNCSTNFGSRTSDDNITENEVLSVTFSKVVAITDILFRNAIHGLANGTLVIDGSEQQIAAGKLSETALAALGKASTFTFGYGGTNPTQIYLTSAAVSPVPLPAGVVLLLTGLAGLGAMRRRRNRVA